MITKFSFMLPALLCAAVVGLAGCVVEPAKPYVALPSPDDIRQRTDTVTKQPTLNLIPRADQREQGDGIAAEYISKYRRIGRDVFESGTDARFVRLKKIFDKVHARSHLDQERLQPVLVAKDQFQAYTTGGTIIIFYTGLTERLSDDALAMVIGHEIAHLAAGHVAEQSSRDLVNVNANETQLLGSYSIINEHEADAVGMVYATLAGFDPAAAAAIWSALARDDDERLQLFNTTHPSDGARADILREKAALIESLRNAPDWVKLRQCNPVYCATSP